MQIAFLADYPHFVEPLARYHIDEWSRLLPWWHYDDALAELEDHASRKSIPTTLLALDNDRLLGSASLVEEDLPKAELPAVASLSPWLASVFVVPEARGRGIGRALVERAVMQAAVLGIETLYLFTAGQETFYRQLRWSVWEQVLYHEREGTIMYRQLTIDD
ncbi:GNAT family N-acetyltransferase [Candidatus Entotheonella palauensis]|uniref:GNAT family N-acetyltransferase n=1 Tax=Candidatus Entotheonella palauensis TaxID=93172 RepID=UPI000B7DFA1A|nr:GNAT family N-acetyltransferase [Candidatus Entotheonella palauensis]